MELSQRNSKSEGTNKNKYYWKEFLKPIRLDDDEYDSEIDKNDYRPFQKKSYCFPDERMKRFNPVPIEEILKKINFYFFPYSPVINTNRCMTFEIDEKQDYIKKLR